MKRRYKIKWWTLFNVPNPKPILGIKAHANALLAAAKIEEEYLDIMHQLLKDKIESSNKSSKVSTSEDSEPLIDLKDDNEDDFFGIFPPVL